MARCVLTPDSESGCLVICYLAISMLTEDLIQKVRQLQVYTGRMVDELFAGEYSSAFKGRGMEFDEVRAYAPGDDVRTIDWNVTARTGEPFIKRFVEERELTVMLVVDLSASGDFGSIDRVKNETAAEICAVVAMAATKNHDKVGLLVFTDHVEHFIPPAKGSRHVWRVVRDVLGFRPKGRGTDAAGALDHLARVLKKRAVVFVVSDFLFARDERSADGFDRTLSLLTRRHDVIAISVSDPRERELVGVGLIDLVDAETGERRVIDTGGRRRREKYHAEALRREHRLERSMRKMGVDLVQVRTHEPYIHKLIELFRRRERRR